MAGWWIIINSVICLIHPLVISVQTQCCNGWRWHSVVSFDWSPDDHEDTHDYSTIHSSISVVRRRVSDGSHKRHPHASDESRKALMLFRRYQTETMVDWSSRPRSFHLNIVEWKLVILSPFHLLHNIIVISPNRHKSVAWQTTNPNTGIKSVLAGEVIRIFG